MLLSPSDPLGLFGVPVLESDFLVNRRQVRFPRSKKKRVRKKWAKQEKNYAYDPDPQLYEINALGQHYFMGHPATVKQMRAAVRRYEEEELRKLEQYERKWR